MPELADVVGKLRDAKRFKPASEIKIERLKTPSMPLNLALGGGLGYGRQVLFWGSKSAGKTSFLLQCMAQAQQDGKICSFVDVEGTFEPEWAKRLGVEPEKMLYAAPKSLNEIDKTVLDLLQAGTDMLILDSITGGVPSAKLSDKGEYLGADASRAIGMKARQTTELVEGWNLQNDGCLMAIISQTRKQAAGHYWVDKSTNGQALEFYSSQIVRLNSTNSRSIERTVNGMKRPVGREVDWTVVNNKLGPQWGAGTYDFYFSGEKIGVDSIKELLRAAISAGVVERKGAWYYLDEERKWQGLQGIAEAVEATPALLEEIESLL